MLYSRPFVMASLIQNKILIIPTLNCHLHSTNNFSQSLTLSTPHLLDNKTKKTSFLRPIRFSYSAESQPLPKSIAMDETSSNEVLHDYSPFLKIYKNGSIERLQGTEIIPPCLDTKTGVESKDIVISSETGLSARLFIPKSAINQTQKIPLLVYYHGGGFVNETPFSNNYHNYLNCLVSKANAIAVSVHYRRAPEHPVPICYEDSWAALKWATSHFEGKGSEDWLNSFADFSRVFVGGDSAGANIAHHVALRVGLEGLEPGVKLVGIVLIHPYFWGEEPIGAEKNMPAERRAHAAVIWKFACPTTSGSDDPMINPDKDPKLGKLGCEKVIVCVAEKDLLKDRGFYYAEMLKKSGWGGKTVEVLESKGEDHVFHLMNPDCDNALDMLKKVASFMN